jgi:hypothetical protein
MPIDFIQDPEVRTQVLWQEKPAGYRDKRRCYHGNDDGAREQNG